MDGRRFHVAKMRNAEVGKARNQSNKINYQPKAGDNTSVKSVHERPRQGLFVGHQIFINNGNNRVYELRAGREEYPSHEIGF